MTTLRQSPDTLIPALLRDQSRAAAAAIGLARRMTSADFRSCLVHLESLRLVTSRQDARVVPSSRVYAITREGMRKVDL